MSEKILPEIAFTKLTAGIGTPGSGKSYNICEQLVVPKLKRREQVVIIDPTGAWFGVTLKPDGKTPSGFDVAIFGGDHGNMPLTPNMGTAVGELLGKQPISAVLDLSNMELSEQIKFMSDWAVSILLHNKKPITVVIDEADEFVPQQAMDKGHLSVCKGRVKRLITRGRKRGFRPVLITQRPQAVDKGAFNMVQVLIALQCSGMHERKMIDEYVRANGDPKAVGDMVKTIPELRVGEAWVWAPRSAFLKRVKFGKLSVYDSFKEETEEGGFDGTVPVSNANLKNIKEALTAFEEQRKANDPELLKKRIAELERQVKIAARSHPAASKSVASPVNEKEIYTKGYNDGRMESGKEWAKWGKAALARFDALVQLGLKIAGTEPLPLPPITLAGIPVVLDKALPHDAVLLKTAKQTIQMSGKSVNGGVSGDLKGPERRIMQALSDWRSLGFDDPTREQVAIFSAYHVRTGSFLNALGALRSAGLIEYGNNTIHLTSQGATQVVQTYVINSDEVQSRIRKVLDGPQAKVFDAILQDNIGARVSREVLADRAGYHIRTGSFLNALGRLRTLGVVEYDSGAVYVKDWVGLQ